jgi:uncharacterized protein YhdP
VIRKLVLTALAIVILAALMATLAGYWFFAGDGLRLAIEQQASVWLGHPVHIGQARARFFPRAAIQLEDVQVGEPASLILAEVELSTNLRALLRRRVEDASITLADSLIEMPLPFGLPAAEAPAINGADPAEAQPESRAVEVVSIGTVSLRNIRLTSRGRELLVSADASLVGDRLTLRQFAAESGGTRLEASGEVDLVPRLDAQLQVHANRLDLDELLALAAAFTPDSPSGGRGATAASGTTARIVATLSADAATAGGVEVTQLSTAAEVDGNRVSLSALTFQLFGGSYEGSLTAQLGAALAVALQSRVHDVDVAQLAAFGGSPDTVTGTLAGSGTFSGQGADFGTVLASANGKGTASITDGTVRGLDVVRTVVLFFGRPAPDTAAASDRFDRIDVTYSLARGVFRADPFTMRSADADIKGAGTLTVETQALDGTLDLSLSEELSSQAGAELARYTREGNRVVLPARIGGRIGEPRITIDAAAAVQRGLRNEVQRRLGGIFDRLRGQEDPPE